MRSFTVTESFLSKCTGLSLKGCRWPHSLVILHLSYPFTGVFVNQKTGNVQTICKRSTCWWPVIPLAFIASVTHHPLTYTKFGKSRRCKRPGESYVHHKHPEDVNTMQYKYCQCWQNAHFLLCCCRTSLLALAKLVPSPSPSLPQTFSIQSQSVMIIKNNEHVWRK